MGYSNYRYCQFFLFAVVLLFTGYSLAAHCWALEPDEILVLANINAARSVGLADYYMKKRGIPPENLVKLLVTDNETCSRSDYDRKVAAPVRRFIMQKKSRRSVRCLVIMYGLPLRVLPPELTRAEREHKQILVRKQQDLTNQLNRIKEQNPEDQKNIKETLNDINKKILQLEEAGRRSTSSLDSEIALALEEDYPLSGWLPNPYFIGYRGETLSIDKENVLMVSRLDGPTDQDVKRIIDDSLLAEKNGLRGRAYFDARWPDPGDKKLTGYGFYDQSIHRAADRVKKSGLMPVVIDKTERLFQPGDCPEAALYCGWYSLALYIDAFAWQPGSVGYHIASSECTTLKSKNSRVWCKMMIAKGAAATVGPVDEPYVQAFPVPEIFFGLLVDGYLSLAECYMVSLPFLSWKMILIGDPLYQPFKNNRH